MPAELRPFGYETVKIKSIEEFFRAKRGIDICYIPDEFDKVGSIISGKVRGYVLYSRTPPVVNLKKTIILFNSEFELAEETNVAKVNNDNFSLPLIIYYYKPYQRPVGASGYIAFLGIKAPR